MPPWQKGVSPNPGGRPSYKPLSEAYRRLLDMDPKEVEKFVPGTAAEKIARRLVKLAYDRGSLISAKELADRVEGRAAFAEEDRSALAGQSTEEKRAQLAALLQLLAGTEVDSEAPAGVAPQLPPANPTGLGGTPEPPKPGHPARRLPEGDRN